MSGTRKRKFNEAELEALVDGVTENYDVLYGRLAKRTMVGAKNRIWNEILQCVNAQSDCCRSVSDIQIRWRDIRLRTAKRVRDLHEHSRGTGGGPALENHLSPLCMKVWNTIDIASVVGVGGLDSNEPGEFEDDPMEEEAEVEEDISQPSTSGARGGGRSRPPSRGGAPQQPQQGGIQAPTAVPRRQQSTTAPSRAGASAQQPAPLHPASDPTAPDLDVAPQPVQPRRSISVRAHLHGSVAPPASLGEDGTVTLTMAPIVSGERPPLSQPRQSLVRALTAIEILHQVTRSRTPTPPQSPERADEMPEEGQSTPPNDGGGPADMPATPATAPTRPVRRRRVRPVNGLEGAIREQMSRLDETGDAVMEAQSDRMEFLQGMQRSHNDHMLSLQQTLTSMDNSLYAMADSLKHLVQHLLTCAPVLTVPSLPVPAPPLPVPAPPQPVPAPALPVPTPPLPVPAPTVSVPPGQSSVSPAQSHEDLHTEHPSPAPRRGRGRGRGRGSNLGSHPGGRRRK